VTSPHTISLKLCFLTLTRYAMSYMTTTHFHTGSQFYGIIMHTMCLPPLVNQTTNFHKNWYEWHATRDQRSCLIPLQNQQSMSLWHTS